MTIAYRYGIDNFIYPTLKETLKIRGIDIFNTLDTETIRENLKGESEVARKINYLMDKGEKFSDSYFIDLLAESISHEKENLLVDFPRNLEQLNVLNYYLYHRKDNICKIVYFKINNREEFFQMANKKYGKVYNSETKNRMFESLDKFEERTLKMLSILKDISQSIVDFNNFDISVLNK
jgi:adenylate kinase family enzyme